MIKNIAVFAAVFTLAACGAGPVKVIDPLTTEEAPASVTVVNVDVEYSQLGAEKITKDDLERAEGTEGKPAEEIELTDLPLTEVLKRAMEKELQERDIKGETPVAIKISVDTMQYQNGLATILLGSSDELAGAVTVTNAETGAVLSELYVDLIKGNGGLLGLAIRGWGIRERFAEDFADHIADQLYGKD